jgi:hypothetical protein
MEMYFYALRETRLSGRVSGFVEDFAADFEET